MPRQNILHPLDAFTADHYRCGELDAGASTFVSISSHAGEGSRALDGTSVESLTTSGMVSPKSNQRPRSRLQLAPCNTMGQRGFPDEERFSRLESARRAEDEKSGARS